MEEKKKLQALWTNTNNIAIHQTVIVLAPSQLFQKLISSSHLAPYFLALIEVDFRSQPMRKSPSVSFPFHSFISHSIPSHLPGRPCIPAKPATPLSHPPLTLLSISRGLRSRRHPLSLSNSAICPPSVLWHLPCSNSLSVSCCCRCHSPLPPRPAPWQEALHSQLEMRTMQLSVIHSL